MSIGIAITTFNRPETLEKTIAEHLKYLPRNARIIVVDDGSDHIPIVPDNVELYLNGANLGIAASKNRCLELLCDCDHIFLFDSDCYPITKGWERPYVKTKEPHLLYQFRLPQKPTNDMRELYRDNKIVAYSHTRGAMIYVHRSVLNVVGGMNPAYGLAGYEHPDWTNRIHNAGLTTHRAMDVPNSDKLLYCLDQDGLAVSSIPASHNGNHALYVRSKSSSAYKEYRT